MNKKKLIEKIYEMEYEDLMDVLSAATRRWGGLFPDWEIVTFSAPRNDPAAKKNAIEHAFSMFEQEAKGNALFFNAIDLPEAAENA